MMVRFNAHTVRDSILYTARSTKEKPANIRNEDLPAEIRTQRAELRAIANQARSAGAIVVKLQGGKLTIDSKVYTHSSIKEPPAKFSLEAARTKYVNDGTIGFYSKYLANFCHAPFGYDGKEFVSVEQMFPVKRAEMTGQQDLVPVICDETECEDKET